MVKFKKLKLVYSIAVVSIFCFVGCDENTQKIDDTKEVLQNKEEKKNEEENEEHTIKKIPEDWLTYTDEHFNFRVSYPEMWTTEIEEYWEGTEEREACPDGGIKIFINYKEYIRVFGQYGNIAIQSYIDEPVERSSFITNSKMEGTIYTEKEDEELIIRLVFKDDRHHAVFIHISPDNYNKYKNEIETIMKSIEILKK